MGLAQINNGNENTSINCRSSKSEVLQITSAIARQWQQNTYHDATSNCEGCLYQCNARQQVNSLPGTTIVQVGHGLVDCLHHSSHSGVGSHVDSVQVVIGANKDDIGVGWIGITVVVVQIGCSLQNAFADW